MKTKIILALALLMTAPVQAEVFKCKSPDNKTIYQKSPCSGSVDAKKIEIKKRSAEKESTEAAKLEAWTARHAADEAKELADAKELRARELREAEVKAQQINAAAQLDQVEAQRRQARALEINATTIPYSQVITVVPSR